MASIRDLVTDPEGSEETPRTTDRKTDYRYSSSQPSVAPHLPPPPPPPGRRESSSTPYAHPPPPFHPLHHPYYDHPHHHGPPPPGSGYPYPPPPPPGGDYPVPLPHHYPYHGPPYPGYHHLHHPPYPLPPPGHGYPHHHPHMYPPAPGGSGSSSSSSSPFRSSEEKAGTPSTTHPLLAPKHPPHPVEGAPHQQPATKGSGGVKKGHPSPPVPHPHEASSPHLAPIKAEDECEGRERRQSGATADVVATEDSHAESSVTDNKHYYQHAVPPSSSTSAARRSAAAQHSMSKRRFRIKIVQQPLHARMCGFGEKDRRPIDPPPIVQLIMEDDEEERREKEGVDSVDQQGRSSKKHGTGGKKTKKKSISEQWTCNDLPPKLLAASRNAAAAAAAASSGAKPSSSLSTKGQGQAHSDATSGNDRQIRDEGMDGVEVPSRTSASVGGSDVEMADADGSGEGNMSSRVAADSSSSHGHLRSFKRHRNSSHDGDEHGDERDELSGEDEASSHLKETSSETQAIDKEQLDDEEDEEVDFLRHDPLFVLHASLWSEDGTQVRSMIATPSQQDPPKLTRILMGSIVVSPTLLNNTEGEPGWYFSFPDLSIRTEGIYTLKFSLIRFGSFNFNVEDGGQHASDVIDEAISQPFTVFSAKKFPGMTESTELSKTFAKQGLKIPIRNDLRVRKADRE